MSEKEKQDLLEQVKNLTPAELTKLCLKVIKSIVKRDTDKIIKNHTQKDDKNFLIDMMIENDIKIDEE